MLRSQPLRIRKKRQPFSPEPIEAKRPSPALRLPVSRTEARVDARAHSAGQMNLAKAYFESPEGRQAVDEAIRLQFSPNRTTPVLRSFEDVLLKLLEPDDPNLADLDIATAISPSALILLRELVSAHRSAHIKLADLTYDAHLESIAATLQEVIPTGGGVSVAQLEAAAAKLAPKAKTPTPSETPPDQAAPAKNTATPATKPNPAPPAKESAPVPFKLWTLINAACSPTQGKTLSEIASPDHVRVIETIVRVARAKMPLDMGQCTNAVMEGLCVRELTNLAPGHATPSLKQLSEAAKALDAVGVAPEAGLDMAHLKSFDPHLRQVCEDALGGDDASTDHDEAPVLPKTRLPKTLVGLGTVQTPGPYAQKPHPIYDLAQQVPFNVSPSLHKRTAEHQIRAFFLTKNNTKMGIALQVFGKLGITLGAEDPDLMRCCKGPQHYFRHDPKLREHMDNVAEHYKLEVAVYDELMEELDWKTGKHTFPPGRFDDVFIIHLEYCTSFMCCNQRSGTKTWGEIWMILFAYYAEWAELPAATFENVNCALKARNVFTTPIDYIGKKQPVPITGPIPYPIILPHAHQPPAPAAAPAPAPPRPPRQPRAPPGGPAAPGVKPPKGNVDPAGVVAVPWTDILKNHLCANCYAATHPATACTVPCRRARCHPPWLPRFDGHLRKDCKA